MIQDYARFPLMVLLVMVVSACATTPVPGNQPISQIDESAGYRRLAEKGVNTNLYFTEVSFDTALSPEISRYLNNLPTSLQLEDEQVDRLIAGARLSLRHDASFKKFKQNNSGRLTSGAIPSEDLCRTLGLAGCPKQAQE